MLQRSIVASPEAVCSAHALSGIMHQRTMLPARRLLARPKLHGGGTMSRLFPLVVVALSLVFLAGCPRRGDEKPPDEKPVANLDKQPPDGGGKPNTDKPGGDKKDADPNKLALPQLFTADAKQEKYEN